MSGATVKDWLIGNMGTQGEYQYQTMHLYTTVVVAVLLIAVIIFGCCNRSKPQRCRTLLVGISVFHIVFEILWRLIYVFIKGDSLVNCWPMYPCNLGGVLIPIFALLNLRRGKQMFYLFGFVGGILTFAMPEGIFSTDVLVFPILKSILQHTGLLLIPALEFTSNSYRPTLKDMGWVTLGCLVHFLNCEGIDRLLGLTGDYMFYRSGMPFVIPGVSQYITLSVFALVVFALLSLLCDVKGSVTFLKSLTARRKTHSA